MRTDPRDDTKLAAQLLRFSSFHSVSLFIAQGVALGSTFVLVNFLTPVEYGLFALLMLYAATVSLVISLVTKPGTMRRVFGSAGDDDDDDEDGQAETQSGSPETSLGTGLALTLSGGLVAIVLTAALAGTLSDDLLAGNTSEALALAALLGGLLSLLALVSGTVWVERRPAAFAGLAIAQPCLAAAGSIPLVVMDAGVEGAIGGIAAGTAVAGLIGIYLVRRSFRRAFSLTEVTAIVKAGAPRIPVVFSFWIVGYAGVFLTSRYLSTADVGLFHFSARIAGIAVFVSASYRMALRPLLRSLAFAEAEADQGGALARGTQLRYFVLLATGILLATSLFADAIVGIAPPTYAEAADLVPLLAAALLVPRLLQVLNKCVKFSGKRRLFPTLVVAGAVAFCAGAIVLLPQVGIEGVPFAMGAAFAVPVVVMGAASQTSRTPIAMPYGSSALAIVAGLGCWATYQLISPDGLAGQLGLSAGLLATWLGAIVLTGAIPRSHLSLIWPTLVGAARPERGRLDPQVALGALNSRQRETLRHAITAGNDLADSASAERALRLLQRSARAAGGLEHRAEVADPQLIRYLFVQESFAAHDAVGRQLVRGGGIAPRDLSQLEELVIDLRNCPEEAWTEAGALDTDD